MTTLHLDCSEGATKERILEQLINSLPDPPSFINRVRKLSIPDISIESANENGTFKMTISSTEHHEGHHHHKPEEVCKMIEDLPLPESIIRNALGIYDLIGEAEAKAHNVPIHEVHFHEVGSRTAMTYIVSICMAIDSLSPDMITSNPIRLGFGKVKCDHGLLDIPAPATGFLLENMPTFVGDKEGEYCTPTGAAVVKYFTNDFE